MLVTNTWTGAQGSQTEPFNNQLKWRSRMVTTDVNTDSQFLKKKKVSFVLFKGFGASYSQQHCKSDPAWFGESKQCWQCATLVWVCSAEREWRTSFTFGLTPCLAEWQGRRKCVQWAGGHKGRAKRTGCIHQPDILWHCLPFLFPSQTVLTDRCSYYGFITGALNVWVWVWGVACVV